MPVVENTRESESVNEETIRRMIEKMAKKSEKERKFSVMELVSMLVSGLFEDQDSREMVWVTLVCILGLWALFHTASKIKKWWFGGNKSPKAPGGRPSFVQSAVVPDMRDVPETSATPRSAHHHYESTPVSRPLYPTISPMTGLAVNFNGLSVTDGRGESYALTKKRTAEQLEAMSRFTSRQRANDECFERYASDLRELAKAALSAYGERDREELLCQRFVNGLNHVVAVQQLKLAQYTSDRARSFDDIVEFAMLLWAR